eukprot:1149978-Pelagomonas_calceolata.AAC.2
MLPLKCIVVVEGTHGSSEPIPFSLIDAGRVSSAYILQLLKSMALCVLHTFASRSSAANLLLHCCRQLVHALVLHQSQVSGQIEDDCPCGNMRETRK